MRKKLCEQAQKISENEDIGNLLLIRFAEKRKIHTAVGAVLNKKGMGMKIVVFTVLQDKKTAVP